MSIQLLNPRSSGVGVQDVVKLVRLRPEEIR